MWHVQTVVHALLYVGVICVICDIVYSLGVYMHAFKSTNTKQQEEKKEKKTNIIQ